MSSCRKACSDIDQLFGKGKRCAFLTEIVEREVRKQKLLRALDEAAGCWKPEDHPELEKAPPRSLTLITDNRKDFAMGGLTLHPLP